MPIYAALGDLPPTAYRPEAALGDPLERLGATMPAPPGELGVRVQVQPGFEGFAALGDVLAGGAKRGASTSYYKGVSDRLSQYKQLEGAREVRARAMARDMLPDLARTSFRAHGMSDADAELGAAVLGMAHYQPNLGQVTGGLQDLGEMELERQQVEAMRSGNVRLANQLAAVRSDKNYEPVRAVDGNLIPSGVELGDPAFQVRPLPQTTAEISVRDAQRQRALRPPAQHASSTRHSLGEDPAPATSSGARPGETAGQAEVRKARAAIAAGLPRATAVAHMRSKGFGHLADLLSKEGD